MAKPSRSSFEERGRSDRRRVPQHRFDAMIEEAIVDAYTESEQVVGFHATIDMHLDLPFQTVVLGVAVVVKKVDVTTAGEIVALCYRGRERQAISILELPWPDPSPAGWEWIEACRRWTRGHR
jgi:hypothetical protein